MFETLFLLAHLHLGTALGQSESVLPEPDVTESVPANVQSDIERFENTVPEVPKVDLDQLLREAVRRIDVADYVGAEIKLILAMEQILQATVPKLPIEPWIKGDVALKIHLDKEAKRKLVEALYLYAGTLHEKGDHEAALAIYDGLLLGFPSSHRALDTQYRRATAHSKNGRHQQAIEYLKEIGPRAALSSLDKRKLKLMRLTFKFREAPSIRGTKRIERQMRRFSDSEVLYDRARIRTELVTFFHLLMRDYPFEGTQNLIIRNHREREILHAHTVRQLEHAIALKQPQWVATILTLIGENMTQIGDDLLDSPIPPELGSSYHEAYRTQMRQYVEASWMKALRYTNEGHHLATRLGLGDALKQRLVSLKEQITKRIEGDTRNDDGDEGNQSAE